MLGNLPNGIIKILLKDFILTKTNQTKYNNTNDNYLYKELIDEYTNSLQITDENSINNMINKLNIIYELYGGISIYKDDNGSNFDISNIMSQSNSNKFIEIDLIKIIKIIIKSIMEKYDSEVFSKIGYNIININGEYNINELIKDLNKFYVINAILMNNPIEINNKISQYLFNDIKTGMKCKIEKELPNINLDNIYLMNTNDFDHFISFMEEILNNNGVPQLFNNIIISNNSNISTT
jgi:hypothetical protein